jgi:hypothetical protein
LVEFPAIGSDKVKGPGVYMLPARAISIKNKHLLVIYAIPARGFTAVVSVFMGTPPTKPLICKIRSSASGGAIGDAWAHHPGDESKLVFANSILPPGGITWMPL